MFVVLCDRRHDTFVFQNRILKCMNQVHKFKSLEAFLTDTSETYSYCKTEPARCLNGRGIAIIREESRLLNETYFKCRPAYKVSFRRI